MPESVDISHALKLPPRQVVRYFESKGYDISWNWWETWQDAHATAFTVAKAARMDVLGSLRTEMSKAFTQGITEQEFVRTLTPRLQKLGWWGKQVIVDAAGKAERVQLGSPHRLKTIYRTNLRTGYAHGRYRAQADNTNSRPYFMYDAVNDARTRPGHAALDGRVFRHDDPIWDTHYPPNGWNCRCMVHALSEDEIAARGLTVGNSQGGLRKVEQEVGLDKHTGEVITTQGTQYRFRDKHGNAHTLLPDAGWNYNPGKAQALFDIPGGDNALGELVAGQKTFRDFALTLLEQTPAHLRLPVLPRLPKTDSKEQALAQVITALGIPKQGHRQVKTPDGLDDVIIRKDKLPHIVEEGKGNREQFANTILPTLQNPLEVWLTEIERPTPTGQKQRIFRRRFIALFGGNKGKQGLAVIEEGKDGSLLWTFVPMSSERKLDKQRAGFLLYRKRKGQ